jgi:DNA-binding CsgD family transcriptional regulator
MTTVLARERASSVFEEIAGTATPMSRLRQAFGRLRDARSVKQLMRKAVVETCRSFGFDRAVLFSVPGDAETTAYVAAPIMPEGDVAGILHADCLFTKRPLGPHDRDTLWAFAEGVGYLLERAVLRERLDVQCENDADLTPREREVLVLMGAGATNAAIASRLVVSENTVKSHVKHILRKLGAGNRAEAVALFLLAQRGGGSNGPALGWR